MICGKTIDLGVFFFAFFSNMCLFKDNPLQRERPNVNCGLHVCYNENPKSSEPYVFYYNMHGIGEYLQATVAKM